MANSNKRLNKKVAIITGGARGIGAATARLFTENGAYVIVADILDEEGVHMAESIGGCYVHCDVSKEADVEAAVELAMRRKGRLDVMFNNAGMAVNEGSIMEMDIKMVNKLVSVNVNGVLLGIKHAAKAMIKVMMEIRTPKTHKAKRVLEKRAPKLVENGKKTLILHGTKTSATLSSVLMELYRLKKGGAIKYSRRNENIRPFESGGETSLEFFSQKTDCSIFAYGSHTKKRPDNLVLGRMYDHHVYDLIEVGIENFKSLLSFSYDKKIAPHEGSKPFICFTGEGFENVPELKQLKEVLTDLFRGEVVDNLNLTGLDRAYICSAVSPTKVFLTHCAIKLKKSGTIVPRIELVEVGPSMDLVIRRNRLPNEGLRKEAMKSSKDKPKKKVKNVDQDDVLGKRGRIFIPEQEVGKTPLPDKSKGVKRERREGKLKKKNKEEGSASKKHKESE